jgi:DNA-binding Lrp family transcriptional regulator
VDDIDRGVIGCLVKDGRATYAQIGVQVGLSASAVKRRVDRLLAIGVLRGFTALVDPAMLGWGIEAYVEVHCRGTVLPRELRRSAEALPETVSACTVSGPADMLVHLRATDVQHLEQAIAQLRNRPNVDHTESVIVLSRLLDRPRAADLPLENQPQPTPWAQPPGDHRQQV